MSNSNSAAKRRRANLVASPMFQSNGQPVPNNSASTTVQQTTPVPRQPMSLQQVIGVFDRRLLYLEDYVSKQLKKVPTSEPVSTVNTSAFTPSQNMNTAEIESLVQHILHEHLSEFNHRYELLAEEIIDLKHIVMKLQSYTLDVNKTLIDERIQILSELRSTAPVQVQNIAGSSQVSDQNVSENITAAVTEEASVEASVEVSVEQEQEQEQELGVCVEEPEHAASNKSKRNKARQKKVVQAIWTDDKPNERGEIHAEVNA